MKNNYTLSVFVLLWMPFGLCVAQPLSIPSVQIDLYTEMDVHGDYHVGSIVELSHSRIGAEIITRTALNKILSDTSILALQDLHDIPAHTYNKTESEVAKLRSQIHLSEKLTDDEKLSLLAALHSGTNVSLKVDGGSRVCLKAGSTSSMLRAFESLPGGELCVIDEALSSTRNPIVVSEVLIYDSARLEYTWGKPISADLVLKITEVIGAGNRYSIGKTGNLTVIYDRPVIPAFKYEALKKVHKKVIKHQIFRKGGC